MRTRTTLPILFCILLAVSACSDQQSAPLTPEEQRIARTYAELLILNELHQSDMREDSVTYAGKVDSVLALHGFERGEFDKEFLLLSQSSRKFKSLFDSTEAAIREIRQRQLEERDQ